MKRTRIHISTCTSVSECSAANFFSGVITSHMFTSAPGKVDSDTTPLFPIVQLTNSLPPAPRLPAEVNKNNGSLLQTPPSSLSVPQRHIVETLCGPLPHFSSYNSSSASLSIRIRTLSRSQETGIVSLCCCFII